MSEHYKRNYALLFADSALFINAMTFLSINAVIPYFLSTLGAATIDISIASALVSIGTFISQPFFARKAMELNNKTKMFSKILFTQRFFFLVFIMTIPLFAKSNPHLMVAWFLVCWGIYNLFVGSYGPFFMSIFTRMIPYNQRGRLLGFSGAFGNITALGSAYLVGILLKNLNFPYNYTVIFGIGVFILLIDAVDFFLMKEEPEANIVSGTATSYFGYIKDIPKYLRDNKKVIKIIIGNSFIVVCNVSLTYYSLYAIRSFNAKAEEIAIFTGVAVTANIIANILFGMLADRFGHKLVLRLASFCGVLASAVILGKHSLFAVYAAFALSNLCLSGYNLSSGIIIVQNSPNNRVPVYISINNMVTLVISSLVMLLSGYIIDRISFVPVFITTGLAGVTAYIVLSSKVRLAIASEKKTDYSL